MFKENGRKQPKEDKEVASSKDRTVKCRVCGVETKVTEPVTFGETVMMCPGCGCSINL